MNQKKNNRLAWLAMAALAVNGLCVSGQAQTVRFKTATTRITVPPSYTGSIAFTNLVTLSGVSSPVDLSVAGLPTGATVSITATNGNALPVDNGYPATALTTNILLNFSLSGVAKGVYPLVVNGASGAIGSWPMTLEVASTWGSLSNNVGGSAGLWSASGSWANSSAPGTTDDVVFDTATATPAVLTNSVVDASTTIGSLRFSQTNGTAAYQTLLLNPGVQLSVTGPNGFTLNRDYVATLGGVANKMLVTFTGTNATLLVSNKTALFGVLADGGVASTLDFSKLDNLRVDVARIPLGDFQAYPYLTNYVVTNSYGDVISKFCPAVSLARTNIIKSSYADANNYTNATTRSYGLCLGNNYAGGTGSSPALALNLGVTNSFYVDSMCFIHAGAQGTVQFNTLYAANAPSALFRGTNGGRMSVLALADFAGTTNVLSGSTPKITANFLQGTVDFLVDRLYVALDRNNTGSGATPQGNLNLGAGVFDCNTAILGYESYGGHTNAASCQATMLASNTVVRINNNLTLGYTTDTAGSLGAPQNTFGKVTLNGATAYINNVSVGGVSKASANNIITLTNGANLVISNQIAGTDKYLDTLSMSGSTLTLNLNGTNTAPVVYATNINTIGSANNIAIASIKNFSSLQIPLVTWTGASTPSFTLIKPPGINAQIIANGANELDLQILTNAPKTIVWMGYSNNLWDNSTANWLDKATGLHTNFSAGDNVVFNDDATLTNINIAGSAYILPGSTTVTNLTAAYQFYSDTGGFITGSSVLTKSGTGSLAVDASAATVAVNLLAGSLTGSAAIGSVTASAGTLVNYSGTIGGNLISAGVATVNNTVNGSLSVLSGGVVTNNSTVNGSISTGIGSILVNGTAGTLAAIGSSVVSSNSFFLNRGLITGANLTVNAGGTFEDTGEGYLTLSGTLTIGAGATFIPGGDGIGTTTVNRSAGSGFPGRVLLSNGSTNIFKVNRDNGTYTKLGSAFQDLGGSSSVRSYNGCIISVTNVGTTPFAAGDTFTFFVNSDNSDQPPIGTTGTATNTYPSLLPLAPGTGLAWNVNGTTLSGTVSVVAVATSPFTFNFVPNYTLTTTTNSTNTVLITEFTWPLDHTGWTLQTQQNPLTVGISTNWTDVFGANWTNDFWITNSIVTNTSVFYRMVLKQ